MDEQPNDLVEVHGEDHTSDENLSYIVEVYNKNHTLSGNLFHIIEGIFKTVVTLPYIFSQNISDGPNSDLHVKQKRVSTFVLVSQDRGNLSYSIASHHWPDVSVSNYAKYYLILYLANCNFQNVTHKIHVSKNKSHGDMYVLMDVHKCWIPEVYIQNYTQLTSYHDEVFMRKDILCKVKQSVMKLLFLIDNLSSHVMSLGTQLKKIMKDSLIYSTFIDNNAEKVKNFRSGQLDTTLTGQEWDIEMMYEELDGRVSRVVSAYREMCVTNAEDKENPFTNGIDIHQMFRDDAFDAMKYFPGSSSIPVVVGIQGYKGFVKIMEPKLVRPVKKVSTLKGHHQGAREVICHWIDRLIGFYRTPTIVKRKIYLSNFTCEKDHQLHEHVCLNIYNKSAYLDGMNASDVQIDPQFSRMFVYDQLKQQFYIDASIVSEVKDIYLVDRQGRTFYPNDSFELNYFIRFFAHLISLDEFYDNIHISPQRLRDISDIHIMDFITVNVNRDRQNWASSGTRLFLFDNGSSFWTMTFGRHHHESLQCIPVLCYSRQARSFWMADNFCRFNKDTIQKLRKVGPDAAPQKRLGYLLDRKIEEESWPFDVHELLSMYMYGYRRSSYTIDVRVMLVLRHHDNCLEKYGNTIYI